MPYSDIDTDLESWQWTGEEFEYPNPWRHWYSFTQPAVIMMKIYERWEDDRLMRVAYYKDKRHKMAFSLPS